MRVSIYARKVEEIIASASSIFHEIFHSQTTQLFLWNEDNNKFHFSPHVSEPYDETSDNQLPLILARFSLRNNS